jgi:hypothetical protein
MKFGGGIRDLRTYKKVNLGSVPPSVQLLFENTKLDLIKTILLLYSYSLRNSRKYRKVSEIVFYYSIVNFDLIGLFLSHIDTNKVFSTNQYFRFQYSINQLLLQLSQLGFIEVKGSPFVKFDDIKVRITSLGISFVNTLDSDYFKKIVNKYLNAIDTIEFSTANIKVLKGGTQ